MNPLFTLHLKNYRCFSDSSPLRLDIQSGATAFVGANNSGKSTLLRFFYEMRHLFRGLSTDISCWRELTTSQGHKHIQRVEVVRDEEELFHNLNDRDIEFSLVVPTVKNAASGIPIANRIVITIDRTTRAFRIRVFSDTTLLTPAAIDSTWYVDDTNARPLFALRNSKHDPIADVSDFLQLFTMLAALLYVPAFRSVTVGHSGRSFDVSMGQQFISDWKSLQTGKSKSSNELALFICDTVAALVGFKSLAINVSEGGDYLQLLINSKSYRLDEVGSGVAHLIHLITHIATKRPALVLIDEPENGLHPSMQVEALSALTAFGQRSLMFATHQYGLASAFANRTFSVTRDNGFSKIQPLEATNNLPELMGAMSYRLSHEIGVNRVLLVEGPTEIRIISHWLRQLGKYRTYILLPLHGSSGIKGNCSDQLEQLRRICPNIHALVDSERTADGASAAQNVEDFHTTCEAHKIPCHVLHRRAIENYFPDAAVKKVFGPTYSAVEPFTKLSQHPKPWDKADNWRIAVETDFSDIAKTDLGKFLQSLPE